MMLKRPVNWAPSSRSGLVCQNHFHQHLSWLQLQGWKLSTQGSKMGCVICMRQRHLKAGLQLLLSAFLLQANFPVRGPGGE